jgi:hypothetical protein
MSRERGRLGPPGQRTEEWARRGKRGTGRAGCCQYSPAAWNLALGLEARQWAPRPRLRHRTPAVTPLASSTVERWAVHPKPEAELSLRRLLRLQSMGGERRPSGPEAASGEESSRPESGVRLGAGGSSLHLP